MRGEGHLLHYYWKKFKNGVCIEEDVWRVRIYISLKHTYIKLYVLLLYARVIIFPSVFHHSNSLWNHNNQTCDVKLCWVVEFWLFRLFTVRRNYHYWCFVAMLSSLSIFQYICCLWSNSKSLVFVDNVDIQDVIHIKSLKIRGI